MKIANCNNCRHIDDVGDGWEYGMPPWWVCEKPGKQHMSNLKGYPFKTKQKCWEPRPLEKVVTNENS